MNKRLPEQSSARSSINTPRSTRGRFWASVAGLITILVIIIDTQISGIASLPLSIAESIGGGIFGMISALTVRITVLDR